MSQKTVLIVDDSRAFNATLKEVVEGLGHTVVVAKDGAEGLEKFRENSPDLVISDWEMPKMNGPDMLREIKKDRPDMPIVLSSARSLINFEEDFPEFLGWQTQNSALFIKKPCNVSEMRGAVTSLLSASVVLPDNVLQVDEFDPLGTSNVRNRGE